MQRFSRRYTPLVGLAVAGLVVGAMPAVASADGGKRHGRDCEVVENVTEQTIRWETLGSGSLQMQVGDAATFYDNIYDAKDKVIGNVVGHVQAMRKRTSDGHIITEYADSIRLPDGIIRAFGKADRTQVLTGKWVRYSAVGLTGKYQGKKGYRAWRTIIPNEPPGSGADIRIELKMVLCG